MQADDVIAYIEANVSYKPGWKITAHKTDVVSLIRVNVLAEVMDSGHTDATQAPVITIGHHTFIDVRGIADVEDLHYMIFQVITEMEQHEAREWFRIRRQAPFHPHTSKGEANYNRARQPRGTHLRYALNSIRTQEGSE